MTYPECSLETQDKISCAQFIVAIFDTSIVEILQLERITSMKIALARAMEIKVIRDQNKKIHFARTNNIFLNTQNCTQDLGVIKNPQDTSSNMKKDSRPKQDFNKNKQTDFREIECWKCGQKGHISTYCPIQLNIQGI